jgi:hypothetical protein
MTRQSCLGFVCLALSVAFTTNGTSTDTSGDGCGEGESRTLIGALSKEIGGSPEQAAGAAGALFGVAKSRVKPEGILSSFLGGPWNRPAPQNQLSA